MFMEDYPLPEPLVGMLRASKLTGKPIVKTELLATKLHVTISWDLATSAPRKTKNRQSTKTAKPAPPTRQPARSSTQQPPAPTPAPATPAPVPTDTRQPCPEKLPPQVAAGLVGALPTSLPASPFRQPAKPATPAATPTKHCSLTTPTPTPAAKRHAPSPDTSTGEDDYTKLQRREPPATINDAPLIANADVSATREIPPTYDDFAIRIHDACPQLETMGKYAFKRIYETKLPNNDEVNIIHAQRKNRDGATLNVDLPAYILRVKNPGQDRQTEKWYFFKGPTSKYHHEKWWNLLDSHMGLQHVTGKRRDVIFSYLASAIKRGNISRTCPLPDTA